METGVLDSRGRRSAHAPASMPLPGRLSVPAQARAVIFDGHHRVRLAELRLRPAGQGEVVVRVCWSGVSTGTERLMWSSQMPPFPGLSYPLVPGYEAVGRIVSAPDDPHRVGEMVFVPGGHCFEGAASLFGGSAGYLVVPGARAVPIGLSDPREGVLLALAATAHHAVSGGRLPDLIIGHGVLGRLAARLVIALGGPAPVVWETNPVRRKVGDYQVISPADDGHRGYRSVCDLSGDSGIIDKVLAHCERGAEINLAGFYSDRCGFSFPAAFMKEMRLRISAEWLPADLEAVSDLVRDRRLSLSGLITHEFPAERAPEAYQVAFTQADCLKMLLSWECSNG